MVISKQQRLRIIAFFDGRPGHEKQTRGILAALGKTVELEVTEIQVPHKSLWSDIKSYLQILLSLPIGDEPRYPEADLLIGTGSRTHLFLLRAKQMTGMPVVTCMTPSTLLRDRFDLIFAPKHDGIAAGKNVLLTVGPPNCARVSREKKSRQGLILIGGVDSKSHYWDPEVLEGYVRQILTREPEIRWTLSSSPRTPVDTVRRFDILAGEHAHLQFFHFEDTSSGWIEEKYDECDKVWVTADSMSMIYEALSAGCRVGILPIRWRQKNNKFRRSEDYLRQESMVVSYSFWLSGREPWQKREPLNEAKRCAEEILKRWPPKS